MRLWPFQRAEKRSAQGGGSQGGAGFTDAIVGALLAQAAGGATADASSTAALEAAVSSYARAFAVAEVTPATPATRALSPAVLALMARDLIRRGEFCHVIGVDRDGARLTPAGSWDVRGRTDPATWRYRVLLSGPSGSVTRNLPAAAVIHGRYSVDPARPWAGVSPLAWASLTGRLHASLEDAIADEAGGTRGHLLPVPQGPDGDELDPDTGEPVDPLADLRADVGEAPRAHRLSGDDGGRLGRGLARGAAGGLEAATHRREPARVPRDAPHRLGASGASGVRGVG